MNKTVLTFAIASSFFLSACEALDSSEEYVGGKFNSFVQKEQENSTVFEVKDNLGITDTYTDYTYRHKSEYYEYKVNGNINEIEINLIIQCTDNGGDLIVYCGPRGDYGIVFTDLAGSEKKNKEDYAIKMLDSLEVAGKTYKNVLEFNASKAKNNACVYDKAFIAVNEGLIRIDLQDTISIKRTSKKAVTKELSNN